MKEELISADFAAYFKNYISMVEEDDVILALKKSTKKFKQLCKLLNEENTTYKYAEDKWTIKEMLLHIIDTERIFNYRALCFARNEQAALSGFNHDEYVTYSNANNRSFKSIRKEYFAVRKATILLFKSFDETMLEKVGVMNGNKLSVVGIGFVIAGHQQHHINVLHEKYLCQ